MKRHGMGALVLVLASAHAATAQGPSPATGGEAPRVTMAVRSVGDVAIDGVDSDAVWLTAPLTSGFRQFDPEIDADPTHPTEFRVAYDDDNLYVFVRALDADPDSIMRALTRRDVRGPSDQIGVLIDSYHDRRSGFGF